MDYGTYRVVSARALDEFFCFHHKPRRRDEDGSLDLALGADLVCRFMLVPLTLFTRLRYFVKAGVTRPLTCLFTYSVSWHLWSLPSASDSELPRRCC
jgi:hypothetical protein